MDTISADWDIRTSARISALLTELGGAAGGARIGALRDDGVTYWQPAPSTGTPGSLAARSEPAHATALGQMLLAHADDGVRNRVLTLELGPHAQAQPRLRELLRSALSLARLSGVAVARTHHSGMGVAVPVLNDDGRLVAGLEVAARDFDHVETVLPGLLAAARRILCEP